MRLVQELYILGIHPQTQIQMSLLVHLQLDSKNILFLHL